MYFVSAKFEFRGPGLRGEDTFRSSGGGGVGRGYCSQFLVMGREGSACSPNPDPISGQGMNDFQTPFSDSLIKSDCPLIFKVPITPKIFFHQDESLSHAEQNSAKIFGFGQNWNFL